MTITTNHRWREFVTCKEVPKQVLADEFDYLDEAGCGFFQYLRHWYHVSQFMREGADGWHGVHCESATTGVLIRLSSDGEMFQVGSFRS